MSVLIKGMEMPASCIACRFGKETNYVGDFEEKCLVNGKCGYVSVKKPRLDTCPLVEVKEFHGDLIEREEVIKAARRADDDRVSLSDSHIMSDAFEEEIKKIATIIEAEGSET